MVETTPLDLTLSDAAALVSAGDVTRDEAVREALAYVMDGDVWQEGRAWVGPRPTGNEPGAALLNEEIRRGLAAANLARELTDRHAAGVVGREPDWDLPGVAETDQDALTQWWDERGVMADLLDATRRALCGDKPVLRLVATTDGQRPRDLRAALDALTLEVLPSSVARVVDDRAAGVQLGVAVFDPDARTLDGLLGRGLGRSVAEVVSIAGQDTLLRLTGDDGEAIEPAPLALGGRLTMHAVEVKPLLTPSLLSLQRHMTHTMTSMGRNVQTAGFAERVAINAERPLDADGNPAPTRVGAGIMNWIYGIMGSDGKPVNADMRKLDPTSPDAFVASMAELVFHAHKEARQLHAILSGDASPSGESRRQAAADFLASLGPTARELERAIRWLLETSYAYALALRGGRVADGLRAQVTMTLSAGVETMEEIKEKREGVKEKLLRRSRYQAAQGVDDPTAENEAIDEERDEAQARAPQIAPAQPVVAPMMDNESSGDA